MKDKRYKLFTTKAQSIDKENKTIRFKISDNSVDRYGEVVDQDSWSFKNFLKNPIMLWNHKSYDVEPEHVLGSWSDLSIEKDGTYATAHFDDDINPKADTVFKQLVKGTLRCVSVGFIPHTLEFDNDTPVLKDCELLEISIVPIPANANAVALAYKEGSLARKDALWMLKSMQDGAKALEEQIAKRNMPEGEERNMDELKTEIKALTELVTQLGQTVTTLSTNVEGVVADVAEVKGTVAELKPAETQAPETPAPAETTAPEPAKGGENDQPGAGEDEFDEDAELTPEIQAQIDAEFDEASEE
ncbi:HK97 family phage prohead protease [Rhodococcus qingshengii]|uniref:HK97 family phage prohead protease n=1 Tax=Rhodococcus qingshengii TaxID=334542 RepID=UPI0029435133|nr:HK97 family phage prohead protease [Rhodococcus qingshengii]WOI85988.1 HK97 family phage prohead protease [Rhodococcus qingshengii]